MSERIEEAATHLATRGLEDAYRRAMQSLTQEERARIAALGVTRDQIMAEAVDALEIFQKARERSAHILGDADPALNAVDTVTQTAAKEHPFDDAMAEFLRQYGYGAAA